MAFILNRVEEEAYGIVLLVGGMQRLMDSLRDAIYKGCLTNVVRGLKDNDFDAISRIVSTAIVFLVIPAGVTMIVAALAGKPMAAFFSLSPELYNDMIWVMLLAGINVLIAMPLSPYTAVLAAHQRFDIMAVVDSAFRVVRAAVIVILFIWVKASVVFVMVGTLVGDIGMRLAMRYFAHRLTPSLRVRVRNFDRKVLWGLLAFGSFLVYATLADIGMIEGAKWLLGKSLSLEFVTFLAIAMYVATMIKRLVQTVTLVLVPVATRYAALSNEELLGETLIRGTRYSAILGMGPTAIVLPVMAPLLVLWLKPELAWLAPYAIVVGICAAPTITSDCARNILDGIGDSRSPFLAILAGAIVTIAGLVLSVGVMNWGLGGAVASICVGKVTVWLMMTFFALRRIRVSRRKYALTAYLQPLSAALPAAGVGVLLVHLVRPDSWPKLIGVCLASGFTFIVALLPSVTTAEWAMARRGLSWVRRSLGLGKGA